MDSDPFAADLLHIRRKIADDDAKKKEFIQAEIIAELLDTRREADYKGGPITQDPKGLTKLIQRNKSTIDIDNIFPFQDTSTPEEEREFNPMSAFLDGEINTHHKDNELAQMYGALRQSTEKRLPEEHSLDFPTLLHTEFHNHKWMLVRECPKGMTDDVYNEYVRNGNHIRDTILSSMKELAMVQASFADDRVALAIESLQRIPNQTWEKYQSSFVDAGMIQTPKETTNIDEITRIESVKGQLIQYMRQRLYNMKRDMSKKATRLAEEQKRYGTTRTSSQRDFKLEEGDTDHKYRTPSTRGMHPTRGATRTTRRGAGRNGPNTNTTTHKRERSEETHTHRTRSTTSTINKRGRNTPIPKA
jgi:hypothetical protein